MKLSRKFKYGSLISLAALVLNITFINMDSVDEDEIVVEGKRLQKVTIDSPPIGSAALNYFSFSGDVGLNTGGSTIWLGPEKQSEETEQDELIKQFEEWLKKLDDKQRKEFEKIMNEYKNFMLKILKNSLKSEPTYKSDRKMLTEYKEVLSKVFQFMADNGGPNLLPEFNDAFSNY